MATQSGWLGILGHRVIVGILLGVATAAEPVVLVPMAPPSTAPTSTASPSTNSSSSTGASGTTPPATTPVSTLPPPVMVTADQRCALGAKQLGQTWDTCASVASNLIAELSTRQSALGPPAKKTPSPEEKAAERAAMIPLVDGATSGGLGPAEVHAVSDVRPVTTAAASVAEVGSATGTHTMATIMLNPLLFSDLPSESKNSNAAAMNWRLVDLTLTLPVDLSNGTTSLTDLPYVGVRARLNLSAPGTASHLQSEWDRRVVAAQQQGQVFWTTVQNNLVQALRGMASPERVADCAVHAMDPTVDFAGVENVCGVLGLTDTVAADAALVGALHGLQQTIGYLGVDVRYESGDPTLSGAAPVQNLIATVVGGKPFGDTENPNRPYGEFRGRLGYTSSTQVETGAFDGLLTAGGEFLLHRQREDQVISLGAGLDANVPLSSNQDEKADPRVDLTAFLSAPLSGSGDLQLGLNWPLVGGVPTLTISGILGIATPK